MKHTAKERDDQKPLGRCSVGIKTTQGIGMGFSKEMSICRSSPLFLEGFLCLIVLRMPLGTNPVVTWLGGTYAFL